MTDWTPLKAWFLDEKRDLPWRNNPSPYQVWISEVMLQQTQVAVVIPYFERWMEKFPTIQKLAEAPIDEVIKIWEGLGYYSRARNIHETAKYIMKEHEGVIPNTKEELSKMKGLGPYTIGAIQSFAFKMKAAAVDGNVIRVLSRYFLIEDDISKGKTVNSMRNFLQEQLPEDESWIISEALIELGATVCQKKPRCQICPLKKTCKGYIQGVAHELPVKSAKIKYEKLFRAVGVVNFENQYLVRRGEKGQIMSDLYEFPYMEIQESEEPKAISLTKHFKKSFGISLKYVSDYPKMSHSFTRFRVVLSPYQYQVKEKFELEGYEWRTLEELKKLAFSSGHRKILQHTCGAKK
jgi:A/G-specific adenine glycosylase